MPDPNPGRRETGYYYALAQSGFEVVAPLILGAYLDAHFGWSPWATVIGLIVGVVGGGLHLMVMVQKIERSQSEKNDS